MPIVIFDQERFRGIYPAFSDEVKFTDAMLQYCFDQAVEIIGNDDSVVPYDPTSTPPVLTREVVLYMLTCHLATQQYLWDDTQSGPVMSAGQGSVSASFGSLTNVDSEPWWMSTKCGAQAWQILKRYANGPVYFAVENFHMGG